MELAVDIALLAVAVAAVVVGWRRGALMSGSSLIGLVLGFWLGITLAPLAVSSVARLGWGTTAARVGVAVGIVVVCVLVIHALIGMIAIRLRRREGNHVVRSVDSAGGAAFGLLTWGAIIWLLAGFLQTTGVIEVTQLVASSRVVAELNALSPMPVTNALGALDNVLGNAGLPEVFSDGAEILAGAQPPDPTIPAAVTASAAGVVKILANEPSCNTSTEGSGWVVAKDRVMTNAHVVAGANTVNIQIASTGATLPAKLVVYDPERDLAVLDVPGLPLAPLTIGTQLAAGAPAVVAGYPEDSSYTVDPARIRQVMDASGTDIYKQNTVVREIYSLRAVVRPGNSGGPLFDDQGHVVGVVFARSTVDADAGYALTAHEIAPVVAQAGSTTTVSSGHCSTE